MIIFIYLFIYNEYLFATGLPLQHAKLLFSKWVLCGLKYAIKFPIYIPIKLRIWIKFWFQFISFTDIKEFLFISRELAESSNLTRSKLEEVLECTFLKWARTEIKMLILWITWKIFLNLISLEPYPHHHG